MNVLFLGLSKFESYDEMGIYTDLLREFIKNGHTVYSVVSSERRNKDGERLIVEDNGSYILIVKTLNIQKSNLFEKGLGTIFITRQYYNAIKKYFDKVKFDLILYPTPPITLYGVINKIKKIQKSRTFLLLKDIFPQNAVDLGILSKKGIKGLIYRYFRHKEKKLYYVSDRIGCMSKANLEYILKHNPEISQDKLCILPNCIDVQNYTLSDSKKIEVRKEYGIPIDKKVFVYGGNLGKPQGIDFLVDCMKSQLYNDKIHFLIIGDGTEYYKIKKYQNDVKPHNLTLLQKLPRHIFDKIVSACDIGMIFLDYRFTIPNFPSRLLSYLQFELPVLACTDINTDIGKIIVKEGFGWWCKSNDVTSFDNKIIEILNCDCRKMGILAKKFLIREYSSKRAYSIISNVITSKNIEK